MRGEITYILRDAETEEIIHEHTQSNILTEWFYDYILNSSSMQFGLVIASGVFEPGRFTRYMLLNAGSTMTLIRPAQVPSTTDYIEFFAKTGSTEAFVQYNGRYSPPTTGQSRTIRTVALLTTIPSQALIDSSPSSLTPAAYSKLGVPCVQTDTQVLDIYYRIYFPSSALSGLPTWRQSEIIGLLKTGSWSSGGRQHRNHRPYPFRLPKVKAGEEEFINISAKAQERFYMNQIILDLETPAGSVVKRRQLRYEPGFTTGEGVIFTSIGSSNGVSSVGAISSVTGFPKIQNVIGKGTQVQGGLITRTASPFLDVDNLPSGTGSLQIAGDWQNTFTPAAPGMFYRGKLPELNFVEIVQNGAVGVSKYRYVRQKYLGNYVGPDNCKNYSPFHPIPGLCDTYSNSEHNRTLLGNVDGSNFTVKQLSALMAYDETSFVVVKANELILYGIAQGEYWRYKNVGTEVTQIAVVSGMIYAGCRQSGLFMVDPVNTGLVTQIPSPAGVDLSAVYGVAKGYNNSLWVVAKNCLAKLEGGDWTKYDATTTPAFDIAGVSDNKYSEVEYLVVDSAHADNQMMLVKMANATTNPNGLGVWWSTTTAAVNTPNVPGTTSVGRPRLNRKHVNVLSGMWGFLMNNNIYVCAFGAVTFIVGGGSNYTGTSNTYPKALMWSSAVHMVKTTTGSPRVMSLGSVNESGVGSTRVVVVTQQLIDIAGNLTHTLSASGMGIVIAELTSGGGSGGPIPKTTTTFGDRDQAAAIILDHGIMVGMMNHIDPEEGIATVVGQFGHGDTIDGGALSWLCRRTYGWDGAAWVDGHAGSKFTHLAAEALLDGLTVRFTNGATGTSFVSPNYYIFGLADGYLKDNATRPSIRTSFYARNVVRATELSTGVVPAAVALPTGVVGLNAPMSSSGISVNASNEFVFPGENPRQYAVGSIQVTGDFVINYSIAKINTDPVRRTTFMGVGRQHRSGQAQYGFSFYRGSLRTIDDGVTPIIYSSGTLGTITAMSIRRVGSTLQLLVNNAVLNTSTNALIKGQDQRLDVICGTWDEWDIQYMTGGSLCPATTIATNGSDAVVFFGDSVGATGVYNPRFCGIDAESPGATSVWLDGVSAIIKVDGTAPAPGEVTIDQWIGCMYFNAADVGKAVTASYTYQHTNS